MDPLSWSRHFRNFPGQGDFPMLDFMMALHQTGGHWASHAICSSPEGIIERDIGPQGLAALSDF